MMNVTSSLLLAVKPIVRTLMPPEDPATEKRGGVSGEVGNLSQTDERIQLLLASCGFESELDSGPREVRSFWNACSSPGSRCTAGSQFSKH